MKALEIAERVGRKRTGKASAVSRRFASWLAATLALVCVVWSSTVALAPWFRLGINGTGSLPGLVYLVFKNELPAERGDIVAFYPPPNRFYPEQMVFVKKAVGLPGDRVSREGRHFLVNGEHVATAKTHSHSGKPLTLGPVGVIPEGTYFMWTPHPDSYDSRYEDIGWIPANRIIGRAVRLL